MNELSFSNLLTIFKKSLVYIIAVALLCGIGARLYCKFVATPTYQSKISFVATNSSEFAAPTNDAASDIASKIQTGDISASRQMIVTYIDIFNTIKFYNVISEKIKEEHNMKFTPQQLRGMVRIAHRSDDSLFIDVAVTNTSKKKAIIIAETIYEYGDDYLVSILPNAFVKGVENTANRAVQNYPNTSTTTTLYTLLGGVLVFVAAIVITLMDKTIKGEKDFSNNYDIPILGNIPNFKAAAREEKK